MKSIINELWHGNIIPQEDSRTNSKEMKELLGYMSRHHEDLEKSFSDEQKEVFEKFHDSRLLERVYEPCRSSHLRICLQARSAVGDGDTEKYINIILNEDRRKNLSLF